MTEKKAKKKKVIKKLKEPIEQVEEEKKELPDHIRAMSDIVPDDIKVLADQLATDHVNWLIDKIYPIAHTEFVHGFRHGYEMALKKEEPKEEYLEISGFNKLLKEKE